MCRSCSSSKRPAFLARAWFAALAVLFLLLLASATGTYAAPQSDDSGRLTKKAQRALRDWQFESAEALFREALLASEKNAAARLGLSFALLKQRKLQDAYEQATRVLAEDARSPRGHALLGTILLTIGDFQRAAEGFQTALALDPREALAIANLGMIDFYENRVDAAYAKLSRAVALDSGNPDYLFNFAQTAARFERYRDAADAYERFLRVAPRTDEDRRTRIRGLIAFLRYLSTQGKLYQVAGAHRVETGFDLVNNRPVIEVRVNGNAAPLRFVLDTGSSMCVISEEAARRVGVRAVAHGGMARAVGGGGKFEIVYGFLQELAIGGAKARNVPVYIRPFFNPQQPVDGYIGLSIVTRYLLAVDYAQRRLTLVRGDNQNIAPQNVAPVVGAPAIAGIGVEPPRTPETAASEVAPPVAYELPARLTTGGFWSGEVRLDGIARPQNFIIDTGASISVVSTGLAAREELSRYQQNTRMRVHGAAGVTENVPLLLLPGVALGTHTRPNVPAVVLDMDSINETSGFEQTGIIGGNVLRHFRVTFDFERMVVRLEPNKNKRTTQPAKVSLVTGDK